MKYYLKNSWIPFLYMLFQSGLCIAIFDIGIKTLGLVLLALNTAIFIFTICVFAFKNGESSYKELLLNDVQRRIIVETGEDRPLNLKEEYAPYKAVVLGLFPLIPLFLFMLIHFIVFIAGGEYLGMGSLAVFMYKCPYAFFEYLGYKLTMENSFLTLLSVPVVFFPIFISYNLGARKTRIINEKIEEERKYLHGEK